MTNQNNIRQQVFYLCSFSMYCAIQYTKCAWYICIDFTLWSGIRADSRSFTWSPLTGTERVKREESKERGERERGKRTTSQHVFERGENIDHFEHSNKKKQRRKNNEEQETHQQNHL